MIQKDICDNLAVDYGDCLADSQDLDCEELPEICVDGVINDGDGLIDEDCPRKIRTMIEYQIYKITAIDPNPNQSGSCD